VVTVSSSVRSDKARVLGNTTDVIGVDPATISRVYRFEWRRGSDATLAHLGNGAIVDAGYAKSHHLGIGSAFKLQTASGAARTFTVRGTYHPADVDPLFGGVVIAQSEFDHVFPQPRNAFTLVTGGTDTSLRHVLAAYPDAQVDSKQGYIQKEKKDFDKLLMLLYVLLALSVVVSLFGMVNTMVLSVFERTRELGMLRAIGMTRRQARRMIRHESVITALIGAALGLPLGVFLAAIVTRGLSDQGVGFHLPVGSLVAFTVVAIVAGILAAVLPARRASRLDVLHALQYE
jgi:putative ABC transport system permease protein